MKWLVPGGKPPKFLCIALGQEELRSLMETNCCAALGRESAAHRQRTGSVPRSVPAFMAQWTGFPFDWRFTGQ